jgi:hypothetical protein
MVFSGKFRKAAPYQENQQEAGSKAEPGKNQSK